ncbi:tyrosine-protein phosphatase [Sporolactobacillus shoreicorticis]|uniref:Tyrosine-protein phosphatase n=1 Tax=Sporolactobacillus shoreicorticis TaxID=1923877 RepID=A0ABW5S2A2_9BACL|nr:tyrosine-protein phosphatase [Sporolactobacillus shoreicorticis]MCO7125336.1 tyrosine-protein phosphatase [Sporolactobacillus shoreicorticis]
MQTRRILLSRTVNTRDLGGYPTNDGQITAFGKIIRSDLPQAFSHEDLALLKNLGITAALDFRSKPETERVPSAFEQASDFNYFHCPFAFGNRNPSSKAEVPLLYAEMLADFPAIKHILGIIARQKGSVFIHCYVGKDRTGVVAALLLLIAGTETSDILADYQISYTYLRFRIRELLHEHPELPDFTGRSDMAYMEKTLDNFYKTYGNVRDYLQKVGLQSEEISALRNKLL